METVNVKFGCSSAVLKFGSWQFKNEKITGMNKKINQKSIKEWSNGHDCSWKFLIAQEFTLKIIGK